MSLFHFDFVFFFVSVDEVDLLKRKKERWIIEKKNESLYRSFLSEEKIERKTLKDFNIYLTCFLFDWDAGNFRSHKSSESDLNQQQMRKVEP
jgi:hypothetical protein